MCMQIYIPIHIQKDRQKAGQIGSIDRYRYNNINIYVCEYIYIYIIYNIYIYIYIYKIFLSIYSTPSFKIHSTVTGRFSNVSFLEIANAQKSPLFRFLFLQDVGDTKVKTCKQNFEGEMCWVRRAREGTTKQRRRHRVLRAQEHRVSMG